MMIIWSSLFRLQKYLSQLIVELVLMSFSYNYKFQVYIHFHRSWCYFVCNNLSGPCSCRGCKWLLSLLCILLLFPPFNIMSFYYQHYSTLVTKNPYVILPREVFQNKILVKSWCLLTMFPAFHLSVSHFLKTLETFILSFSLAKPKSSNLCNPSFFAQNQYEKKKILSSFFLGLSIKAETFNYQNV